MAKIYYVGDWALLLGPSFVESPFSFQQKGTEIFNYGRWLKEALESSGEHQVCSVPSWDFYRLAPGQYEAILEEYDLLVFSDVEARLFQLDPAFFDRTKFGHAAARLSRPNPLDDRSGARGHARHVSGRVAEFQRRIGKGWLGTYATAGDFARPVPGRRRSAGIDRRVPDGIRRRNDHPILQGINLSAIPPILGYNIVQPVEGCPVVARWKGWGDPAVAVGQFGRGRVLAYTSDPAPHWGCNFVYCDQEFSIGSLAQACLDHHWRARASYWTRCAMKLSNRR